MTFNIITDIQAPPERVFAVLCDVESWPEWTPTMTRIQRLDYGTFKVGSQVRIRQPKLTPSVWNVTELEPSRGFTWITRSPGVVVTARHQIDPQAGGSRVTLSLKFAGFLGPLMGRLLGGLNQRYLETEAAGLKQRCEAVPVAA